MLNKVRQKLDQEGADYFLVTDSVNLSYILSDGRNSSERIEGTLIVGKDVNLLLIANFYRYERIESLKRKQIRRKIFTSQQEKEKLLNDLELGGKLLTDAAGPQLNQLKQRFPKIEHSQLLAELRAEKDKPELEKIRQACNLASRAMKAVKDAIKEGKTEIELALVADRTIKQGGSDFDTAFPTLVQTNCLRPHRQPQARDVKRKDMIIVDLGAEYRGYCSDMTRSFCLNPSEEAKRVFEDVKQSYNLAVDNLKPGRTLKDVEDEVKSFLKKRGYDLDHNYLHSLGHGVGLEAHEPPLVRRNGKEEKQVGPILRKDMVLAIEPALYLPQLGGIRIEDTILIKKDGKKEKLTDFPYQL